MNPRALSQALRRTLWSALGELGFTTRTERVAWRHEAGHTDLVEISALGTLADSVGATTTSFGAHVASVPEWLDIAVPLRRGLPAPHYWSSDLRMSLHKTLSQPWFAPFAGEPAKATPLSFLVHREGLKHVLRRDTHDRPDIWYVLDDGTNIDEVVADLTQVVLSVGLPRLDAFHQPIAVIAMVEAGELGARPGSSVATDLIHQARRLLD